MNIQATKIELVQQVLNIEEEQVLQQLKDVLKQARQIDIRQYNKELDEADARIDAGQYIENDEVAKEISAWLGIIRK